MVHLVSISKAFLTPGIIFRKQNPLYTFKRFYLSGARMLTLCDAGRQRHTVRQHRLPTPAAPRRPPPLRCPPGGPSSPCRHSGHSFSSCSSSAWNQGLLHGRHRRSPWRRPATQPPRRHWAWLAAVSVLGAQRGHGTAGPLSQPTLTSTLSPSRHSSSSHVLGNLNHSC